MEFVTVMGKVIDLLRIKFTIYGVSLSFWDVFMWCFVASTLIGFIVSLLRN